MLSNTTQIQSPLQHASWSNPVAILGAGMMGVAIAAAHQRAGIPVLLYDNNKSALETVSARLDAELRLQNERFQPSLLRVTDQLEELVSCKVLIETIIEKRKAKQKLYQQLGAIGFDQSTGEPPLLFSNTSTLSITLLASTLDINQQSRFCGLHFFHPVRKNSMVEVIAGENTAPDTLAQAEQLAKQIGKRPIRVGDGPGFLVNRILNPYLGSALAMLEEGVSMQKIERLATGFGMRMGPFRIMDEIGLDVVLHAGWVLYKAFPDRVASSTLLLKLVEQGRLGRKTGRGLMIYPNSTSWDGEGLPDPELQRDIETDISDEQIIRRLFVPMYEEAIRCHAEGIIQNLEDADLASIDALGFPSEKGGIVQYGQNLAGN